MQGEMAIWGSQLPSTRWFLVNWRLLPASRKETERRRLPRCKLKHHTRVPQPKASSKIGAAKQCPCRTCRSSIFIPFIFCLSHFCIQDAMMTEGSKIQWPHPQTNVYAFTYIHTYIHIYIYIYVCVRLFVYSLFIYLFNLFIDFLFKSIYLFVYLYIIFLNIRILLMNMQPAG